MLYARARSCCAHFHAPDVRESALTENVRALLLLCAMIYGCLKLRQHRDMKSGGATAAAAAAAVVCAENVHSQPASTSQLGIDFFTCSGLWV